MSNSQTEEMQSPMSEDHRMGTQMQKILTVRNAIIIAAILILIAVGYYEKGLLIAATVNGSPISRLAVIQELEKRSGKAAIESLISKKLINLEASKKGIKISDADVVAEIKNAEAQIVAQGGTLAQALAQQNLTMADLKEQIIIQKEIERLIADSLQVTDAEVAQYIKDNKVVIPKGQEAAAKSQIIAQLKQTKFQSSAQSYIDSLRVKAKVNYFVKY